MEQRWCQFVYILLSIISFTIVQTEPVKWEEAKPGEFPYMVWLNNKASSTVGEAVCVGSLISTEWIITDGICGDGFIPSKHVIVPVQSGVLPEDSQQYNVDQKIVHEDYKLFRECKDGGKCHNRAEANSIVLLKLRTPVDLVQGYAPVVLPGNSLASGTVDVVKPTWRLTETVVMYHQTKLHNWEDCKAKYAQLDSFYNRAVGMLCATERPNDVPTSGPFVVKGQSPDQHTLVGVLTKDDHFGENSVYIATDIGKYREWIKKHTGV